MDEIEDPYEEWAISHGATPVILGNEPVCKSVPNSDLRGFTTPPDLTHVPLRSDEVTTRDKTIANDVARSINPKDLAVTVTEAPRGGVSTIAATKSSI